MLVICVMSLLYHIADSADNSWLDVSWESDTLFCEVWTDSLLLSNSSYQFSPVCFHKDNMFHCLNFVILVTLPVGVEIQNHYGLIVFLSCSSC
jgi:hypothetical protein